MLAVIDNYDSFTFNLVQYLGELGVTVEVFRNDLISVGELADKKPEAVLISPGPGTPDSAGISLAALSRLVEQTPILGVCLGHQSIGQHFGGRIIHARNIMHGKVSNIHHNGQGVFFNLPNPFPATRYHSLVVDPAKVPDTLQVTAWTQDEQGERVEVMGLRHRQHVIEGVQFHPESIRSEHGHALLRNFLVAANVQCCDRTL